ncbi:MAG: outer membrane protein assembly factor BamD [Alloprevotella sp.]|nr:outer membrane protein assembly factor BamD [Alloprevotella sp.]
MRNILLTLLTAFTVASCGNYNALQKSADYAQKYEAAKQFFAEGYYNRASMLLGDVVKPLKGSDRGEEALYLLGLCQLKARNYDAAATTFQTYYKNYPKGFYAEEARYNSGMALYKSTPEPKLDQTATYEAVTEFQNFIETYPDSRLRNDAQDRIFELQDKLVEKEYLNAKLYYDLGNYFLNGQNGNYQACIVTAENAIKDFPYSKRREDFAFLILKAKFDYAKNSIAARQEERYSNAIDEYYGFTSEYPESKHMDEANEYFSKVPKNYRRSDEERRLREN